MADEAVGADGPSEDKISLTVRAPGTITQGLLGMEPYLLLKVREGQEEDIDLEYVVEIGGVPQDGSSVRALGDIIQRVGQGLSGMTDEQVGEPVEEEDASDPTDDAFYEGQRD